MLTDFLRNFAWSRQFLLHVRLKIHSEFNPFYTVRSIRVLNLQFRSSFILLLCPKNYLLFVI